MPGPKKKKWNKTVYRSLALISQFGISMIVPICLCAFGGLWLDRKLGTNYWMVILFFVGALAGARNVYIMAHKIYGAKEEDKSNGNK